MKGEKYFVPNLLFCVLLLKPLDLFPQEEGELYSFPEEMPEAYKVDARSLYDSIMGLSNVGPPDARTRHIERFAESNSYGLQELIKGGSVYMGWKEMEQYLNSVLDTVIPDSVFRKEQMKVYLSTWTGRSAHAFFDGTILFNVGMLADLSTESELAFVLGHEGTHILEKDIQERFFRRTDMKKKANRSDKAYQIKRRIEEAAYSREQERRADSLGALFAHGSGYDLERAASNLYKLKKDRELRADLEKDEAEADEDLDNVEKTEQLDSLASSEEDVEKMLEKLFQSHPQLQERLQAIERIHQRLGKEGRAFQIKKKGAFYELRKKARHETLHLLISNGAYEEALVRAFRYHLQSPKDPIILQELLKAHRRWLYTKPGETKKGFLNAYNLGESSDSASILGNLHFLIRDTISYRAIEADHLVETAPFRTNEEAFEYFFQKAHGMGNEEALLTSALHHHVFQREAKKDSLLNAYLSSEDSDRQFFARALKEGKLYEEVKGGKDLLIVNRPEKIVDTKFGYYRPYLDILQEEGAFISHLKELIREEFPDLKTVYLPEFREEDLQEFVRFKRFFSLLADFSGDIRKVSGKEGSDKEGNDNEGSDETEQKGEDEKEHEDGKEDEMKDVYFAEEGQETAPDTSLASDSSGANDTLKENLVSEENLVYERRGALDLELFLLAPEGYDYFRKNNISTLGFLMPLGYNDRTKLSSQVLNAINPWFYLTIYYRFRKAFVSGSDRYYHQALHVLYDAEEKGWEHYQEGASYKATKNNLVNAAYYAIGNSRWE